MSIVPLSTEVILSNLVEQICVEGGTWSDSQTPRHSCGDAHALRFQDKYVRQERCGREGGLEVTVQEQQGWVKKWDRDGEMVRNDTYANNFLQTLEPCVCTRMKMCGCAQTNCATEKSACNKWVYVQNGHPLHKLVARGELTLWLLSYSIREWKCESELASCSRSSFSFGKRVDFIFTRMRSDFIIPCPSSSFLLVIVP